MTVEIPRPGTRIVLVSINDPHTPLRPGACGRVTRYDRIGGLSVRWDSGSTLSLLPDQGDRWAEVPEIVYDYDRAEGDPCEALTPGCPVNHTKSPSDSPCETW